MRYNNKAKRLYWSLLKMTIVPIFLLALVITSFSAKTFADALNREVKSGLMDLSSSLLTMYDHLYPGDYKMVEQDEKIYFFKGNHQINGDFSIIDAIKKKTGADITIFYQDIRIITTICDKSHGRIIGTKINSIIKRDVLETGVSRFYSNALINNMNYFAYYAPIINKDGTVMGMIFAGKPTTVVNKSVSNAIIPIYLLAFAAMIIAGLTTLRFSQKLVLAIKKIELFQEKVAKGNLNTSIDADVLNRSDELGEMGRNTVNMQKALRSLVEQDILTQLNNRRYGEIKLKQVQETALISGEPFCVAIGDLDFFKKVNDTYGHECGDMVLASIAQELKKHMMGKGFVARWGGEEFLLVFDRDDIHKATEELEVLLREIGEMKIIYNNMNIKVTMTFGITAGSEENMDYILRNADEKLYQGKNNGRNQVVSMDS